MTKKAILNGNKKILGMLNEVSKEYEAITYVPAIHSPVLARERAIYLQGTSRELKDFRAGVLKLKRIIYQLQLAAIMPDIENNE